MMTTVPGPTAATTDTLARAATSVLPHTGELAHEVASKILAELPELGTDTRVRELFVSTVLDSVVSALRVVSGRTQDTLPPAPPVALEFARRLAQQGVPITTMLRAYRLGQAAFQQHLIARIATENVTVEEMADASMALSSLAFGFIDAVSEQAVDAYQVERDDWVRHRNASRLTKVQAVLAGQVADACEVVRGLGFAVATEHVGAVLWSSSDTGSDPLARLERHVASLAAAMGAPPAAALSVEPDGSTAWAWIPADTVDADAIAAAWGADGVHAALGQPAAGIEGFRVTHRQALQAQTLALAADTAERRSVTASAQLGALALVAADIDGVRAWVQDVLGGLAADDEHAARLRDTIWSYLSNGSSLNAAAHELHLHKNTIQYRIRKAEETRGRSLSAGRTEVEVALRACRLLGTTVLRPSAPAD